MRKIGNIWPLVLLILIGSHWGPSVQWARAESTPEFTLGAGDVVGISVWNQKELSMEIVVQPDGEISYPMLGRTNVSGKPLGELETSIRSALSRYLKDPRVSVNLVSSANSFAVTGEVVKPGYYEIKSGCQLAEAVACAGGLTENALSNSVTLIRKGNEVMSIDLEKVLSNAPDAVQVELKRGDLLVVPKIKLRVSIFGGVSKPGLYDMTRPSARLTDALAMAGGATSKSKSNCIDIVRHADGAPVILRADLGTLTKNAAGEQNVELRDGDIIYVPERHRIDWDKGLQTVFGITGLINLVKN